MYTPTPDHPPPKYQLHVDTPPLLPARPRRLELESKSKNEHSRLHHHGKEFKKSFEDRQEPSLYSHQTRDDFTPVQTPRVQRYFSSPLSPHLLLPDFTPPNKSQRIQKKRQEQFSPIGQMISDPSSYSVATTMTVSYKRSETDSSFTDSLLDNHLPSSGQNQEHRLGNFPIREIQSPPLPPQRKHNTRSIEINTSQGISDENCYSNKREKIAKYVRILWVGLSLAITSVSIFSYLQPYWFVSQTTMTDLGMFGYCEPRSKSAYHGYGDVSGRRRYFRESSHHVTGERRVQRGSFYNAVPKLCSLYGGKVSLGNLPSNLWQMGCVLFGGGCALMIVSSICALLCVVASQIKVLRDKICLRRLCGHTAYVQVLTAFLLMSGVSIFPFGLDSTTSDHYCLGSNPTKSAGCQLGWSYVLAVMAAALSVFSPLLAYYSKEYNDKE